MPLIANIEPVSFFNETATQLGCYVSFYDLNASNCILYWWLYDENQSVISNANWDVPFSVIEQWGTDDTVLIESLAAEKGFTITSIV